MNSIRHLYYYSPVLFLILLTRPSLDPIFDTLKGSGGMGLGALVNIFMIVVLYSLLRHFQFKISKAMFYWLPLLSVVALSLYFSPYLMRGIRSLMVMLTYATIFLLPYHFIKTEAHFKECVKIIVYSSFLPLAAVLYDIAFPASSTTKDGFRLFSTFNHPNVFAFYLVTIVSVCFFVVKSQLFLSDRRFIRQCWIVLGIGLLCIIGTKTRSAWAVIGLLVLVYGLFEERRYVLYFASASFIALMIPSVQDRVFDLFQGNDTDAFLNDYETLNSYAWRKVIWASALEKFWEHPFLGFGYESFTFYSGSFFLIESEVGAGAHNTYVQVLFETGLIGFIALLWLLVPIAFRLWNLRTNNRENIIVFTLFMSYCLVHYSDNVFDYLVFNWYFWFFIGAFLAYKQLSKSTPSKEFN